MREAGSVELARDEVGRRVLRQVDRIRGAGVKALLASGSAARYRSAEARLRAAIRRWQTAECVEDQHEALSDLCVAEGALEQIAAWVEFAAGELPGIEARLHREALAATQADDAVRGATGRVMATHRGSSRQRRVQRSSRSSSGGGSEPDGGDQPPPPRRRRRSRRHARGAA